jgi:hypothetical protein
MRVVLRFSPIHPDAANGMQRAREAREFLRTAATHSAAGTVAIFSRPAPTGRNTVGERLIAAPALSLRRPRAATSALCESVTAAVHPITEGRTSREGHEGRAKDKPEGFERPTNFDDPLRGGCCCIHLFASATRKWDKEFQVFCLHGRGRLRYSGVDRREALHHTGPRRRQVMLRLLRPRWDDFSRPVYANRTP